MANNKFTRRKFLAAGTAAGFGMAALVVLKVNNAEEIDKVICISREGKLYEVQVNDLEGAIQKGRISNEDLLKWSGTQSLNSTQEL